MIGEAIISLSNREDLSYDTAKEVMNEIMDGKATPVQISAYLTSLAMKGETIDEISGSAESMISHQAREDKKSNLVSLHFNKELVC